MSVLSKHMRRAIACIAKLSSRHFSCQRRPLIRALSTCSQKNQLHKCVAVAIAESRRTNPSVTRLALSFAAVAQIASDSGIDVELSVRQKLVQQAWAASQQRILESVSSPHYQSMSEEAAADMVVEVGQAVASLQTWIADKSWLDDVVETVVSWAIDLEPLDDHRRAVQVAAMLVKLRPCDEAVCIRVGVLLKPSISRCDSLSADIFSTLVSTYARVPRMGEFFADEEAGLLAFVATQHFRCTRPILATKHGIELLAALAVLRPHDQQLWDAGAEWSERAVLTGSLNPTTASHACFAFRHIGSPHLAALVALCERSGLRWPAK